MLNANAARKRTVGRAAIEILRNRSVRVEADEALSAVPVMVPGMLTGTMGESKLQLNRFIILGRPSLTGSRKSC